MLMLVLVCLCMKVLGKILLGLGVIVVELTYYPSIEVCTL